MTVFLREEKIAADNNHENLAANQHTISGRFSMILLFVNVSIFASYVELCAFRSCLNVDKTTKNVNPSRSIYALADCWQHTIVLVKKFIHWMPPQTTHLKLRHIYKLWSGAKLNALVIHLKRSSENVVISFRSINLSPTILRTGQTHTYTRAHSMMNECTAARKKLNFVFSVLFYAQYAN